MQTPVSARIPEPLEDTPANQGVRELAGIFATSMLSPGEADVVPVELTYEDGQHDIVLLVTGAGYTSLAAILFGNEQATSDEVRAWGASIKGVIQSAIDAYDIDPDEPTEAEVEAVAEAEAEFADVMDEAAANTHIVKDAK